LKFISIADVQPVLRKAKNKKNKKKILNRKNLR